VRTLPSVGLLEACDDPRLFGLELWPRQRERLEEVERGPRVHVWAFGRRSSKTTMGGLVGLWCCLFRPELREYLRPGELGYATAIATSLRQARLFVNQARSIVERSPLLADALIGSTEDELVFSNGNILAAFPCTARGGRGWPIFCLLMDEAAHFMSDTEGPQVAERVFRALEPSTAQFGDDARTIIASTPWGTDGFFADTYQQAAAGELVDAVAARASTGEMNPTIGASFLERERARDPEGFRSEYEAEFVGSGGAYLDPERVDDAVADRGELLPDQGTGWIAGLDPAFSSDPFGLAIVGRDKWGQHPLLLALARSWRPRRAESFEEKRAIEDETLREVADVCLQYQARVLTDQFAAPAVVAYLRSRGLAVSTVPMTASSKTAVFAELRARLYSNGLELYDHRELLAELRRLRTRYSAGSAAVVNPRIGGSHGDIAQALALAVHGHRGPVPSVDDGSWLERLRDYEPSPYAWLGDHTITMDSKL
jgi:hypothetical protein